MLHRHSDDKRTETGIDVELRSLPESWRPEDVRVSRWEDWHCVIDAVFLAGITAVLVLLTMAALTR